jgi:hypothetical protein
MAHNGGRGCAAAEIFSAVSNEVAALVPAQSLVVVGKFDGDPRHSSWCVVGDGRR